MSMQDSISQLNAKLNQVMANQTHFHLAVKGLEAVPVQVLQFQSHAHALSQDYAFDVVVKLKQYINVNDYIGVPIQLTLRWDAGDVYINGVVSAAAHLGRRTDGEAFSFTIASPLRLLKDNLQSRVFLNKDVTAIVQEVLLGAGLNQSDFTFHTEASYRQREYTVQYNETDYDFIQRLMAYEGLFYSFEQTDKQAVMHIYDSVTNMPSLPGGELLFNANTGSERPIESVYALDAHASLTAESVQLAQYNYRTPEASLTAESKNQTAVKGKGLNYRVEEDYKTLDEGERLARVRQEALDWQRTVFHAKSDCRGLLPGQKFTLLGHPVDELNGDYFVISIEHYGDQRAGQAYDDAGDQQDISTKQRTYENNLLLIKAGIPYRSVLPAPITVPDLFTATIETTGGDYAYLDEQGRYRLRMPFDLSERPEGQASHPIRLAQPYAGNQFGFHFPLHAGTEVIVSCQQGDLNRPIILGAVSNPDTPNPVSMENHSRNVLRTWGGNELFMEDRRGKEKLQLFTLDGLNRLELDANAEGHQVRLVTEQGDMKLYAKKTMLVDSGETQTTQSGNDYDVLVHGSQQLTTKNKQIESRAATDMKLEAGQHVQMQAEKQDISMAAATDMNVDIKGNMSLQVNTAHFEAKIDQGHLHMQAAKAVTVQGKGGGLIHVGQSGGALEVSTGGDLTIDGKTITINAGAINIRAKSIGNN